MSTGRAYDVFLSHSHEDALVVEELATRLEVSQVQVWLDRWILVPGEKWVQEINKALNEAKTCAVCFGSKTPKGWFQEEIERALNRQAEEPNFRVIPVLLPGSSTLIVDQFLKLRTWVDFSQHQSADYAHNLLLAGIRGEKPPRRADLLSTSESADNALRTGLRQVRALRAEGLVDHDIAQHFQKELLNGLLFGENKS